MPSSGSSSNGEESVARASSADRLGRRGILAVSSVMRVLLDSKNFQMSLKASSCVWDAGQRMKESSAFILKPPVLQLADPQKITLLSMQHILVCSTPS